VAEPILQVNDLRTYFSTEEGIVKAVDGVSFTVLKGERFGVVGESGCGKSVTALSVMRLIEKPAGQVVTGEINFKGQNLLDFTEEEMQEVRGGEIAMIFQDPMTALNPVFSVGSQIIEAIRTHRDVSKQAARARAIELLDLVGVPEPRRRVDQFPHEYSGGMRQRAMIAMAIANEPKVLIADEPTTALDVTVQAQVMEVLRDVQEATGSAMLLITHDLGLVAGTADRVQVMYASRLVETGGVDDIFYGSRNPYTRALLESIPDLVSDTDRLVPIPGNPPSLLNPPSGCPFRPRCSMATDTCAESVPDLTTVGDGHATRCHHADRLVTEGAS